MYKFKFDKDTLCDCGNPAIGIISGAPCCRRCKELEDARRVREEARERAQATPEPFVVHLPEWVEYRSYMGRFVVPGGRGVVNQ